MIYDYILNGIYKDRNLKDEIVGGFRLVNKEKLLLNGEIADSFLSLDGDSKKNKLLIGKFKDLGEYLELFFFKVDGEHSNKLYELKKKKSSGSDDSIAGIYAGSVQMLGYTIPFDSDAGVMLSQVFPGTKNRYNLSVEIREYSKR